MPNNKLTIRGNIIRQCEQKTWAYNRHLMPDGLLAQFPLQGAAVHVERTRGGRDVAVVLGEHALDMFPFQTVYGQRLFGNLQPRIGLVAL